jgi:hypothetical protein
MKKIGIIGTRKRNIRTDYQLVHDAFFEVYEEGDWIISGHCPVGGDAFAEKIAYDYGIPILLFPPKKKIRKEFFARNTLVAENSDMIIACLVRPHESIDLVLKRQSGGTEDTIKKFVKMYSPNKDHISKYWFMERKKKVIIV